MRKLPLILAIIGVACVACGVLWNIWAWFEHWNEVLTSKDKFFIHLYPTILILVGFMTLITSEAADDTI